MDALDFFRADAWSALLLVSALKGAIILATALLATRLMTRASASTRHAVWVLAFMAALAMPALLVAVPGWNVPVLPEGGISLGLEEEVAFDMSAVGAQAAATAYPSASQSLAAPSSPTASLGFLLLLCWGVGAFFVAIRWTAGVLSARVLTGRAIRVTDPAWLSVLDDRRKRLGLVRPVALKISAHTSTPMTWGVFKPVVLLPQSALRWAPERLMVVLAHELAHVRRVDGVSQWIAQAACVLHWYNPLVWKSYQRFLVEREHACDDYVLRDGARASSYAEHLLDIAKGLGDQRRAELAMAPMAHRTQIEERLRSILNDQQRRDRLSRGLLFVVCTLVLALVWPVAAITFVPREKPSVTWDAPAPPAPPSAPAAPNRPRPPAAPAPPAPALASSPDVRAPSAPEMPRAAYAEPNDAVASGPFASVVWTRVNREITDEQRRAKWTRDNEFRARLDASLADEIEDARHAIQVDVNRIVRDVENERWDGLEEHARNVVRRVEDIVARSSDLSDVGWDGPSAETLAALSATAAVAAESQYKRDLREASRRAQPSAHPSRIREVSSRTDECESSNSNE